MFMRRPCRCAYEVPEGYIESKRLRVYVEGGESEADTRFSNGHDGDSGGGRSQRERKQDARDQKNKD